MSIEKSTKNETVDELIDFFSFFFLNRHNAYYDYLLSVKQKATLFYVGSNVLDWPLEAQRGLNDGHEM